MKQITKDELLFLYNSSRSGGILKIKKWFSEGKMEFLKNIEGDELKEKVFRFLFPDKSKGCEICGKPSKLISIKKGFNSTCSKSCAMKKRWENITPEQEINRQIQRVKTNIQKYGVKNPMQTKEIAQKISKASKNRTSQQRQLITNKRKATNLEKYGVEFTQQLKETQDKAKRTCLDKYGVENPSQSIICKEKRKQTHLKRFGVENSFQSEIIKEKIKETNLKKYGVENPSQSPKVAEKKIITHLNNYGVEYPSQNIDTFEKQRKNMFKRKYHKLPSGKIIPLQGYEPFAVDELLNLYDEQDLELEIKKMPEIWYIGNDNKNHRYIPDIYIPKENKIIEVKSTYTMKLHLEINWLKKQRCLEMGFDFEFRIYDGKMNLIDEKEFL